MTEPQAASTPVGEPVSPFYISSAGVGTLRLHVLKRDDCFAIFNQDGNICADAPGSAGVFFEDTRYVSRLRFTVEGAKPLLLSSSVSADNAALVVDLTNPDLKEDSERRLARDTVHLRRTLTLGADAVFSTLTLCNYSTSAVKFLLMLEFEADFADIFELRGAVREKRGRMLGQERDASTDGPGAITVSYLGLDRTLRRTRFLFAPAPMRIEAGRASWTVELAPGAEKVFHLTIACEKDERRTATTAEIVELEFKKRVEKRRTEVGQLHTSNEAFDSVLNRARADLDMLTTETPYGYYPYAGIPWFCTAFGRDGIITALQCLWIDPQLAAGTLRFLAAHQAAETVPDIDAEPGKILHEMRKSEMAVLGEVPFRKYYGSVDTTPLFIVLAAAHYQRTGDLDLIREIWPNIEAALAWMSGPGDADQDDFIEYQSKSGRGLANQGWKDSGDSIFHDDGRLAEPPIALAEVQSYAFGAWLGAGTLARALSREKQADDLVARAGRLRRHFEQKFWLDDIGTYALALDRNKKPCRVRSSNAGHVLLTGLAAPERATRVADTLMAPQSFSSWGIRTVAEGEARYNPISYHDGSVWPHDTALIAMGFERYGFKEPTIRILTGLFDTARSMEWMRLPELICGFARQCGRGPTSYPVACAPQAWSSASILAALGAALGVSFEPQARRISFRRPMLPPWLDRVQLSNLQLSGASADLELSRIGDDVAVHVQRRHGPIAISLTM